MLHNRHPKIFSKQSLLSYFVETSIFSGSAVVEKPNNIVIEFGVGGSMHCIFRSIFIFAGELVELLMIIKKSMVILPITVINDEYGNRWRMSLFVKLMESNEKN